MSGHLRRQASDLSSPPRRPTVLGAELCAFSTSPSQLQEVTMDRDNSGYLASANWNTSGHGHTMKEYEEQLTSLRKENFNLKLRVYFLEERLDANNALPYQDNLAKKNIELKVNLESLRRELEEKKELLCAAAKALEIFESTAAKKEDELTSYINMLEEELSELRCDSSNMQSREASAVPDNINSDTMTVSVDNSVALYAAAFNIKPTPSEVKSFEQKTNEVETLLREECEKLKDLLAAERDIGAKLRETIALKDQMLYEQSKKLQSITTTNETKSNEENIKLDKLQQENVNACQMIQSCLIRIKQMDKETKKLKMSLQKKEDCINTLQNQLRRSGHHLVPENIKADDIATTTDTDTNLLQDFKKEVSSSQRGDNTSDEKEYDWINAHLENKIKSLRQSVIKEDLLKCQSKNVESQESTPESNIQDVLTNRLQELAYFLDSLLHHKCVLEEDKRKKIEKLLEQSLDLTSCLTLDPEASKLLENSFMDWSLSKSNISQSLRLDNLTKLFGHHFSLDDSDPPKQGMKKRDSKKINEEFTSLQHVIGQQDEIIDKLYDRLKTVKNKCICASSADEDNDDDLISLAFNRRTLRKRQSKPNRNNKTALNSTWHGANNAFDHSESECWSEPDRSVSLARMGGPLEFNVEWQPTSEDDCQDRQTPTNAFPQKYSINNKNVVEYDKKMRMLIEEKALVERLLAEANDRFTKLDKEFELTKIHYNEDIKDKQDQINLLTQKLDQAEKSLQELSAKHEDVVQELNKTSMTVVDKLSHAENKIKELSASLVQEKERFVKFEKEQQVKIEELQVTNKHQEKREGEWVSKSRYDALRKEVDQAALQASQATLDRTVAIEHRMRSDSEVERLNRSLSQARLRLSELESYCAELMKKIAHLESWQRPPSRSPSTHSHSPRASSPDQGIDSDRLSSLEMIETVPTVEHYSGNDLASENVMLREKLERTQKKLMYAVGQLNAANNMKKKVNRTICQEIHKTTSVLRQVRDNLNGDS